MSAVLIINIINNIILIIISVVFIFTPGIKDPSGGLKISGDC